MNYEIQGPESAGSFLGFNPDFVHRLRAHQPTFDALEEEMKMLKEKALEYGIMESPEKIIEAEENYRKILAEHLDLEARGDVLKDQIKGIVELPSNDFVNPEKRDAVLSDLKGNWWMIANHLNETGKLLPGKLLEYHPYAPYSPIKSIPCKLTSR